MQSTMVFGKCMWLMKSSMVQNKNSMKMEEIPKLKKSRSPLLVTETLRIGGAMQFMHWVTIKHTKGWIAP